MKELSSGRCEHCNKEFGYQLCHCGFGDCSYAYCDKCGMTAVLSYWSKRMPKMPSGCPPQQEICVELEQYLKPCDCGGVFKKGSFPRCFHCNTPLSAPVATHYIEANAPGRKAGGGKVTGTGPIALSLRSERFETISGSRRAAAGVPFY
jgi:hypothetical protein